MKRTLIHLALAAGLAALAVVAAASPVDVNHASASKIAASLKGVGQAKAQAIVAYRKAHGAFHSADELSKVKGIGTATVAHNRKDIRLKPVSRHHH